TAPQCKFHLQLFRPSLADQALDHALLIRREEALLPSASSSPARRQIAHCLIFTCAKALDDLAHRRIAQPYFPADLHPIMPSSVSLYHLLAQLVLRRWRQFPCVLFVHYMKTLSSCKGSYYLCAGSIK